MCKRGREKAGASEEQDYNVGSPLLLPQPDPCPVRKLETSGKCTVVGGRTDRWEERALAYRIHYEKAINFPRRFFFFVCFL